MDYKGPIFDFGWHGQTEHVGSWLRTVLNSALMMLALDFICGNRWTNKLHQFSKSMYNVPVWLDLPLPTDV